MSFRRRTTSSISLESPQAMFRDFSGRQVPGVLDYQASALDDYLEHGVEQPNVSLQMPTGSGKTLIGLLIAEWRRRKFRDRALYLCPTNQLATQVHDQAAQKYGMGSAVRFKGSKKLYSPESKAAYESGEAIAITSYSALFNSNPYFSDATFIILDDSHVADNYVSSLWALEISAAAFPDIFERVARFLSDIVSRKSYHSLVEKSATAFDRAWADLVPMISLGQRHSELVGILDDAVQENSLRFPWSMIRDHLLACNIFLGAQRILIKPFVPPTNTFAPFSEARQRLFMSATLGAAGNFERMTGVAGCHRLNTPAQLSNEAVGRRFFVFPGQSLSEVEQQSVVKRLMICVDRSVLLVPSTADAEVAAADLNKAGLAVHSIQALEENKLGYVTGHNCVAILAGRYDGLDFPDAESRLLVINGMPTAFPLQELFLKNKAQAAPMLEDRARTRIIQAVGRCTRSENDFSAVVILDDSLIRWFRIKESQSLLPLELQAEVLFGLEQGAGATEESICQQFSDFLDHKSEWEVAEDEIRGIRADVEAGPLPFEDQLAAAAKSEVAFTYAMYGERFVDAVAEAKRVIDALLAEELRGYRAFWELQAAVAARMATIYGQGNLEDQVTHLISRASKGLINVDWLLRLARPINEAPTIVENAPSVAALIENVALQFDAFGISSNARFEEAVAEVRDLLSQASATQFELGLVKLGTLFGFDAGKIEEEGSPDPWWEVADALCFVFEAHSEATSGAIGSRKSRQAALQDRFIRTKLHMPDEAKIVSILLSDGAPNSEASSIYLDGTTLWPIADFRAWASRGLDALHDLKLSYSYTPDLRWRITAADTFVSLGLDPASLLRQCAEMRWRHT